MSTPIHTTKHPLAGKKVQLTAGPRKGALMEIEDWWDRASGVGSWKNHVRGNPACIIYASRVADVNSTLPNDDEVVYGKVGALGHIVHISEFEAKEYKDPAPSKMVENKISEADAGRAENDTI